MKKIFLCALLLAAAGLAASASGAPARQRKAHTFRCTDRNTSLRFVVYENGSTLEGGAMYVEGMQVGVLKPEHAGTGVFKAAVVGNAAADIAFQLHKSPGRVVVANYGPDASRVRVCKASYKSRIILARHHSVDGIYQW